MKTTLITLLFLSIPWFSLAEPIKALLITGGCCHDYGAQSEIIPAALDQFSKLPVEWTIYHQRTNSSDRLLELYANPDWARGYDIIVHNECFAEVGEVDYIENILKPHRSGVPAILIHCSMHSYRVGTTAEQWWEFCGVHSPGHGPKHGFEVQITEPEHEIMRGLSNWTVENGELYFVETVYPTATLLAKSYSNKTESMHSNVWVNTYGPNETRVFATTIGHFNETMRAPHFREMITRGLLWAVGENVSTNLKVAAE